MRRVRLKCQKAINQLTWPAPNLTRDGSDRIEEAEYTYGSIVVTYTATWDPNKTILITYTQTIVDKV